MTRPRLVALILLAFAVRAWTIPYGLPFFADEQEGHVVHVALRMGAARELDLGLYGLYGKGFLQYPLLGLYGGLYAFYHATGRVATPADFALDYLWDPTPILVLGRILHIVVSTAGIVAMYAWAGTVVGPGAGLMAAALLAVNPKHWMNSHFPTVETWALCLTTTGLALHARGGRWGILGMGSIGLGGATKVLDAVCAWHPWIGSFRRPKRLALLVGVFTLGFAAGNPFLLLRADRNLPHLVGIYAGEFGGGRLPSATEYIGRFTGLSTLGAVEAIGATGFLLVLVGVVRGGLPRTFWAVPLLFCAFISLFGQISPEYLMAVFPFLLPAAAVGLETLRAHLPRLLGACLLAVALLEPVVRALPWEAQYLDPPQELAVVRWIERNVPSGSTVALLHSGLAYKLRDTAEAAGRKAARERAHGGRRAEYFESIVRLHARHPGFAAYDLRWIAQPYWRAGQYNREILDFVDGMGGWTIEEVDVATMRDEGVTYVVLQNLGPGETKHAALVQGLREEVAANGDLLVVLPNPRNVPVEVYRLRPAGV